MEFVLEFPLYCEVWKVEIHFIVVSTQLPRGDYGYDIRLEPMIESWGFYRKMERHRRYA